jgi:hypothetical protein
MNFTEDVMIRRILLSIVLVCSNASNAAGIYKWVDDKGNVQYSATPPPTQETVYEDLHETLVIPRVTPTAAGKAPRPANEQTDDVSSTQNNPSEQAALDRETLWQQNCDLAQKNLEALQGERDVVRTDENGNKTLLSTEQRQQAVRQTRKDIDYYCKP